MELEDVSSYVLPPNFILSPSLSGSLLVLVDLLGSIGVESAGGTGGEGRTGGGKRKSREGKYGERE